MPQFYFHTDNSEDTVGTDLKNIDAARCEAVKLAGRLLCDEPEDFLELRRLDDDSS